MDGVVFIYLLLYVIMMLMILPDSLEQQREAMEAYLPKEKRKRMSHEPRMKYLTSFSCEETLLRLTQMNAPFDFTFEKESDDAKNQMYVFSIDEVPRGYNSMFRGKVKYKVLVTPAQEGSAVWLFLFTYERKFQLSEGDLVGRLSDEGMLTVFSWQVEKLFEKLLNAVRVE